MKNKDYGSAKYEFEYILENSIETGFIHFSIGICEYYLGQHKDALISFNKAEELGSNVPASYYKFIKDKIKKY